MLLGEHAVLRGESALAAAINQRIRVELTPNQDAQIQIHSALGEHGLFGSDRRSSQVTICFSGHGAHEQRIPPDLICVSLPLFLIRWGLVHRRQSVWHGVLRWIEGAMPGATAPIQTGFSDHAFPYRGSGVYCGLGMEV